MIPRIELNLVMHHLGIVAASVNDCRQRLGNSYPKLTFLQTALALKDRFTLSQSS